MNTLQHLDKLLRKHNARLLINPHTDTHEIILSIPAQIDTDGTITQYALDYRLGEKFPQPTLPQAPLLDADDGKI